MADEGPGRLLSPIDLYFVTPHPLLCVHNWLAVRLYFLSGVFLWELNIWFAYSVYCFKKQELSLLLFKLGRKSVYEYVKERARVLCARAHPSQIAVSAQFKVI